VKLRRLSENTVSAILGAAAFAILSAGTAVAVSTTAVSITDVDTGKTVHVTSKETLTTSERDPYNGIYARVDGNGRQLVTTREGAPKTPHAVTMSGSIPAGGFSTSASAAGPASGLFVVETITGAVRVPSGGSRPMVSLRTYPTASTMAELQLPVEWMMTVAEGFETYVFTLDARAYHVAGKALTVIAVRSGTTGAAHYHVTAIGHVTA